MSHLFLLIASTFVIILLTWVIWRKFRSIAFVLGNCFLFYWGMLGSWIFYFDAISGFKGDLIGLHYYYFFDKLIKIEIDQSFFLAILFHAVFIICVQIGLLLFYKKTDNISDSNFLLINTKKITLIILFFFLLSIFFIKDEIREAFIKDEILYHLVELGNNKFFTMHQVSLQISITLLFIFISIYLSPGGKKMRLMTYNRKSLISLVSLTLLIIPFLALLGNKKELLFSGMIAFLFYVQNNEIKKGANPKRLIILCSLIIIPLLATDFVRAVKFNSLINLNFASEKNNRSKDTVKKETEKKDAGVFGMLAFSNELFFPNFSMYGVVKEDVPLNFGLSFKYLGASLIPRAIKNDRPKDIYEYYVESIKADIDSEQGYTIHHATAWLLNFGKFGIIIGGLLLGFIWGKLSSLKLKEKGTTLKRIFVYFVPAITCAYLPILIRSGIESYKGFMIEGILFSSIFIYFSLVLKRGKDHANYTE